MMSRMCGGALLLMLTMAAPGLSAEPPVPDAVDRLTQAVDDLDALTAELQANQDETAALRDQLSALQSLSEDHRRTLEAQAEAERRYEATVAELKAHDEQTLKVAEDLRAQLARERALTGWLLPAAAVVGLTAVLEGIVLLKR